MGNAAQSHRSAEPSHIQPWLDLLMLSLSKTYTQSIWQNLCHVILRRITLASNEPYIVSDVINHSKLVFFRLPQDPRQTSVMLRSKPQSFVGTAYVSFSHIRIELRKTSFTTIKKMK